MANRISRKSARYAGSWCITAGTAAALVTVIDISRSAAAGTEVFDKAFSLRPGMTQRRSVRDTAFGALLWRGTSGLGQIMRGNAGVGAVFHVADGVAVILENVRRYFPRKAAGVAVTIAVAGIGVRDRSFKSARVAVFIAIADKGVDVCSTRRLGRLRGRRGVLIRIV